jgi:hypothetical protein
MKLRHFFLIVLFFGGFWYLTTHLPSHFRDVSLLKHLRSADSPLQLTEADAAPAYDAEELNNISVYKRVLPSVVNITSAGGLQLLLWGGSAGRPGIRIHSRS